MTATSTMYLGLTLTDASLFQVRSLSFSLSLLISLFRRRLLPPLLLLTRCSDAARLRGGLHDAVLGGVPQEETEDPQLAGSSPPPPPPLWLLLRLLLRLPLLPLLLLLTSSLYRRACCW